jgi:hypothetical protein
MHERVLLAHVSALAGRRDDIGAKNYMCYVNEFTNDLTHVDVA